MIQLLCSVALASLSAALPNGIANCPSPSDQYHLYSQGRWRAAVPSEIPPGPITQQRDAGGKREHPMVERSHPAEVIDVNRPRSVFDCEIPIGEQWYGSRERCLAYMCGGENVYNEYIFDADGRRRKNPCYGQNPTEFPPE